MSPSGPRYASANRYALLADIGEDDGGRTNGDVLVDIDGLADGLIEARGLDRVKLYNDWPNDLGVS
jgi:hypothetical protein